MTAASEYTTPPTSANAQVKENSMCNLDKRLDAKTDAAQLNSPIVIVQGMKIPHSLASSISGHASMKGNKLTTASCTFDNCRPINFFHDHSISEVSMKNITAPKAMNMRTKAIIDRTDQDIVGQPPVLKAWKNTPKYVNITARTIDAINSSKYHLYFDINTPAIIAVSAFIAALAKHMLRKLNFVESLNHRSGTDIGTTTVTSGARQKATFQPSAMSTLGHEASALTSSNINTAATMNKPYTKAIKPKAIEPT